MEFFSFSFHLFHWSIEMTNALFPIKLIYIRYLCECCVRNLNLSDCYSIVSSVSCFSFRDRKLRPQNMSVPDNMNGGPPPVSLVNFIKSMFNIKRKIVGAFKEDCTSSVKLGMFCALSETYQHGFQR